MRKAARTKLGKCNKRTHHHGAAVFKLASALTNSKISDRETQ